MSEANLYDSLQIASNFIEKAEKLGNTNDFEAAFAALEKAKEYAFNNDDLLDDIQLRQETLSNAQRHYIRQLEEEAANLFKRDPFDGQKARQVLQALRQQDSQSQIAQSLWDELQAKEAAERERRLEEEVQQELEEIWQQARNLETSGDGNGALAEYERAVVESSKKVGDAPKVIPLQRLKRLAIERRDRAKEIWEGIPTLISAGQGLELIEYYETLKSQDETESQFFDENGEFVGYLPIDECIDRAKELASRFAEKAVQDYVDQARELLAESPGAAYEKLQEALVIAAPSDYAQKLVEQELKEKIQPAMEQRDKALALLDAALSKEDALESWVDLDQVEQIDRFTPGLTDARQQLASMLEQKLTQLLEKGHQFQDLEDFETAQQRFTEVIDIDQTIVAYNDVLQGLHAQAQEALDYCLEMQQEAQAFEQRLAEIAELSQSEPEQANEALAKLKIQGISEEALAKIERLQVQIDFRLGVDRLFHSLERKMLETTDPVDLIPIEEGVKQACLDYPDEQLFPRLVERVAARRAFLKGSTLCKDPEQYVEAMDLLEQVIDLEGDDASTAKRLLDKIVLNEQQEADITIAIQEATQAMDKGDPRSAFLLLQPFRYAASAQIATVRELIATATTGWRDDIEQQLEALVTAGDFSLPKIEFLIHELERAQSPRVEEWRLRALAPAYANTARDLQDLNRWDEAELFWEEAFRLAPKEATVVEGRRNAHKHLAIARAQAAVDPAQKEQLLNDLNRSHSDDPAIKRYLAAFYYSQKRYEEARLALSQARFLLEWSGNSAFENDAEIIHNMELRIQEAEKVQECQSAIRSQLKRESTINQLIEARQAYEELVEAVPEQSIRLEQWWESLTEATVNELRTEVAEIFDKAGTVWLRAELLCKILVLQDDPQIREQARRMLKLAYDQLLPDIEMVVENPTGVGYGAASETLDNHIAGAKALYERIVKMGQLEPVMRDLGVEVVDHEVDLNEALYELELTMEKLYFTQEKQREVKNQIAVALMTGKWGTIEDSLQELELKGWNQHRGVQVLFEEVEKAKRKQANLETAIKNIKEDMAQEKFKPVQESLAYVLNEDPDDETRLQANLEVIDPYTGDKIRGSQELGELLSEKLAVLDKLGEWQAGCKPAINWSVLRSKISKSASQGEFQTAIELARVAIGQNDEHPLLLRDGVWSLAQLRQFLETFPLMPNKLNSRYAKTLLDETDQKHQLLTKQINECKLILEELQKKEIEFKQILDRLKPLLQRLNERKDFLSSIFASSAETDEVKQQILRLVKRGSQICPAYPGFADFDENGFLRH